MWKLSLSNSTYFDLYRKIQYDLAKGYLMKVEVESYYFQSIA